MNRVYTQFTHTLQDIREKIISHKSAFTSGKFDQTKKAMAGDIWKYMRIIIPPLFCGDRPFLVSIQTEAMRKADEIIILTVRSTMLFACQTQIITDNMTTDEVAMELNKSGNGFVKNADGNWCLAKNATSCTFARISKTEGVHPEDRENAAKMLRNLKYLFSDSGMKIISKMMDGDTKSALSIQCAVGEHINQMLVKVYRLPEDSIHHPVFLRTETVLDDNGDPFLDNNGIPVKKEIYEKPEENDPRSVWTIAGVFGTLLVCAAANSYPIKPNGEDGVEEDMDDAANIYGADFTETIISTYLIYRNILMSPPVIHDDEDSLNNCLGTILLNTSYDSLIRLPLVPLLSNKPNDSLYNAVGTKDIRPTQYGWTTLHRSAGRYKRKYDPTLSQVILEELQAIVDENRNSFSGDSATCDYDGEKSDKSGVSGETVFLAILQLIGFFNDIRSRHDGSNVEDELNDLRGNILSNTDMIEIIDSIIRVIVRAINIDYSHRRLCLRPNVDLSTLPDYIIRLGSGSNKLE